MHSAGFDLKGLRWIQAMPYGETDTTLCISRLGRWYPWRPGARHPTHEGDPWRNLHMHFLIALAGRLLLALNGCIGGLPMNIYCSMLDPYWICRRVERGR